MIIFKYVLKVSQMMTPQCRDMQLYECFIKLCSIVICILLIFSRTLARIG
jgi:hypothetical protein